MEVRNNQQIEAPLGHYVERFAAMDPVAAAARSSAEYDGEKRLFRLRFLGRDVTISHPEFKAVYLDSGEDLRGYEKILLVRYLLEARFVEPTGKYLAYAEMPWGEVYNANFHGRCILRLAFGFGRDLERFSRACLAVGGRPAPGGDVAYDIDFVGNLTVRLLLWAPDEEFPPSSQILFSDNFQYAFNAEDMAVVGDVLIDKLKSCPDGLS